MRIWYALKLFPQFRYELIDDSFVIKEDLDIDKDWDINELWKRNISYGELMEQRDGGEWSPIPYSLHERAETYHKSSSVLKNNHPLMIMLNEERMVRTIISFQCDMTFEINIL